MISPKVIFNCKFTHAFNRREANYTQSQIEGLKKKIARKFDYFSNEEKRVINMFEYYTGNLTKEDRMNLVIEDGSYATKEEIEKRKLKFIKYAEKSNLWQGVISFNNDYLTQNITLKDLEQEMIKNVLPSFFKKMGFKDKKNMAYNLSIHADTDNLHIHFSFIEKKPNYIYSNKKVNYRRKGELTKNEIDFMKNEVVLAVERKNYLSPMITITNKEIDNLKKYFNPKEKNFILYNKDDLMLEENILRLGKMLYDERKNRHKKIKFNSIRNSEIRRLTKEIKNYLFISKDEFYDDYNNFKSCVNTINNYLYKVNIDNNVSNIIVNSKLTDSKQEYLDNYILNAIVNHADYFYNTKSKKYKTFNEDDLLREIILKEFKKDKYQTRYNILENYLSSNVLSNKYKNKHRIINAIKSINSEMEEANKEFSKLFQSSDYQKERSW
ncbi:MAG: relaxase MobL [Clostridia bacterium]|nr:relaxase MobL [Clostridia bacterium]